MGLDAVKCLHLSKANTYNAFVMIPGIHDNSTAKFAVSGFVEKQLLMGDDRMYFDSILKKSKQERMKKER
ncbi:hypothetical protein T03_14519 [Trichinella britovi]|uniref:Uncharacterized protein n=1 Tax=Trichinella britovi TaxID=45882 RepID=A0A0V1C4K8_TRIBR|nr:hypothetical protein T03_14519 [Trichinella britovi]